MFGRQAGDALEVFPEEGLCREIQFVGNFLNRQVGVLEHGLASRMTDSSIHSVAVRPLYSFTLEER